MWGEGGGGGRECQFAKDLQFRNRIFIPDSIPSTCLKSPGRPFHRSRNSSPSGASQDGISNAKDGRPAVPRRDLLGCSAPKPMSYIIRGETIK